MNIDSINKKYILATFKILSPILFITFTGLTYFTFRYSVDEKKRQQQELQQTLSSYESQISEKISILTSSNVFIDFLRSGEVSRNEQLLDIKILFSNFKDNTITGFILLDEDNQKIFHTGIKDANHFDLKLCYLNDFLNTTLGSCRFNLRLFINSESLARWLSQTNPNIETCLSCKEEFLYQIKNLGSFKTINQVSIKLPIQIKASNYLNALLIFELLLAILIIAVFTIIHRTFKRISSDYIHTPIKELVSALDKNEQSPHNEHFIAEISYLSNSINQFLDNQKDQESLRRKASLGELATQVAHDLRSPLEILKSVKSELDILPTNSQTAVHLGIQRLEEIASTLLSNHRNEYTSNIKLQKECLKTIISESINEKSIEYGNLYSINFNSLNTNIKAYSDVNKVSLKNIISNMINNGIESSSKSIEVTLSSLENWNIISIKDKGAGISSDTLNNLFNKGFTTKRTGNGLGLYSAYKEIKAHQGDIKVTSEPGTGTTFSIYLPKTEEIIHSENLLNMPTEIILIDDDKFIRLNWTLFFQSKNRNIKTFSSIDHFLEEAHLINDQAAIYIDSNLGNNLKGELESKRIYEAGFVNLYLSTGYEIESIDKPFWIRKVLSKNPSELFDEILSSA